MRRIGILSLIVLLSMGTALSFHHQRWFQSDGSPQVGARTAPHTSWVARYHAKKFDCLPKDVRLDEVVSYGRGGKGNITVEKKLLELKARCRNDKLVDAKNSEIRFFRVRCWGNPPRDYLEIEKRQHQELEKLKKTYSVIVMTCNPMIM